MKITSHMERIIRTRLVQHLLFWLFSFYVLLRFFSYSEEVRRSFFIFSGDIVMADVIYTFLFHISLVFAVYVNLLLLIPGFLRPRKYILYVLSFFATLFIGTYLNMLTFEKLADYLFPGFYFISYYQFRDIVQFIFIYMAVSSLLKLSKAWFYLNEQKRRIHLLEREKVEAEMKALKSQVDPHFLFNNLNNLYSLALEEDKRTAELILKLSQSMQYMIYECNEPFVDLESEIAYIRNYLDLQRLRSDHLTRIELSVEGPVTNQPIAPLLFIPLIENGFKHGIKGSPENAYIEILFRIEADLLFFQVENNKSSHQDAVRQKHRGIGLKNVRRRLELLYPGKHELTIKNEADRFLVQLKIRLL